MACIASVASVLSRRAGRAGGGGPVAMGLAGGRAPDRRIRSARDLVRATRVYQRRNALQNPWGSVLSEWAPLLGPPPDPGSRMEAEIIAALADAIGHPARDFPYHAESPAFSARRWPGDAGTRERLVGSESDPLALLATRQAALSHPRPVEDRMKIDIAEFDKKYVLKVDLPGTRKKDIWLDVCDDVLTIGGMGLKPSEEAMHSGEGQISSEVQTTSPDAKIGLVEPEGEATEEGASPGEAKAEGEPSPRDKGEGRPTRWLRLERPKSFKARAIRMPKECSMKTASASYRDGVLTIVMRKHESDESALAHRHIAIN